VQQACRPARWPPRAHAALRPAPRRAARAPGVHAPPGPARARRAITVGYAFKKDTKGERHGTPAERQLAEQQRTRAAAASRPHKFFASGPRQAPQPPPTEAQARGPAGRA